MQNVYKKVLNTLKWGLIESSVIIIVTFPRELDVGLSTEKIKTKLVDIHMKGSSSLVRHRSEVVKNGTNGNFCLHP